MAGREINLQQFSANDLCHLNLVIIYLNAFYLLYSLD